MDWNRGRTWLAVLAISSLWGCAVATETGEVVDERTPFSGGKADIYGEDDRRDYFEERDVLMRAVAHSTAMVVRSRLVSEADEPGFMRLPGRTFAEKRNLCEEEVFREQPAPGHCTAFLVAHDVVATAGHCVADQDACRSLSFIFGYYYDDPERDVTLVGLDDYYQCASYLAREHESRGADWALIRLDRPVVDRTPLEYRREGQVEVGTGVAIIGHPSGLPMKLAGGGEVFESSAETHFRSYLDTYGGNSGSPVMNFATGVIEGVHVRGTSDFVQTEDGCFVSKVCRVEDFGTTGCSGNSATRATIFAPFVPPARTSSGWIVRDAWEFEVVEGGEGERDILSAVDVSGAGVVDFILLTLDIEHEESDKFQLFLERDGQDIVDLTPYIGGMAALERTIAIPDFNGAWIEGRWQLRVVVPAGMELPEFHYWGLEIHGQP